MTKRVVIVTGAAKPDSIGYAVAQGLIRESCEAAVAPGAEGSSGPYTVAKAGIMARQLSLERGPDGVRVNCVALGVIASGRLKKVFALAGEHRGPEGPLSQIPLGRVGTVAETAALVVALCTDDAAYMTGVTVDVNSASYPV